jgi:AcrR family transcriptional regulator
MVESKNVPGTGRLHFEERATGTPVGTAGTGAEAERADAHFGNRYGRSERARVAVLQAADNLLVERGFNAVTIERIAARAGVAKQTIYRWWSSKTEILLDAFIDDAREELTPPDSGDLETDLRRYLRTFATFLTSSDAGAVFRALTGQAQHDPQVAERLRTDFLVNQRERERLSFQRALARGVPVPETELDLILDQLVGPIYYRVLVTGEPITDELIDSLVRQCLRQNGLS